MQVLVIKWNKWSGIEYEETDQVSRKVHDAHLVRNLNLTSVAHVWHHTLDAFVSSAHYPSPPRLNDRVPTSPHHQWLCRAPQHRWLLYAPRRQ